MRSIRATARGFTLVELMIAIVIGLILVAAMVSFFVGQRATYGFHEALSRVQENGRFATHMLARDLRMAGFAGCLRRNGLTNQLDPSGTGYDALLFDINGPAVVGWEFSGTGVGDTYVLGTVGTLANGSAAPLPAAFSGNPTPGSDVLVVNSAQPLDVPISGPPGNSGSTFSLGGPSGLPGRSLVIAVTADCSGGDLWQKQSASNASTISRGAGGNPGNVPSASNPFANAYDEDAQLLAFTSTAYFVQPGSSNEPALFMQRLDPTGSGIRAPVELIEGVETMQIIYGVDDTGNRTADRYATAADIVDWARVVSVRVSLLLRAPNRAQTLADLTDYNVGFARIRPVEAGRVRQVVSTTIGIRNRLP